MKNLLNRLISENPSYEVMFFLNSGKKYTFNSDKNTNFDLMGTSDYISYKDLSATFAINIKEVESLIFTPLS